jgi:N-acyl-phosphatidylethanolamine-hydrolysing phospholipase D
MSRAHNRDFHVLMPSTTRPSHHANASRSLFQNPWMVAESTAAPPTHDTRPTLRKSTTYWPALPAGFQLPTLERVRESVSAPYPHPPVKVVKPDWGIHHPTATDPSSDSVPNLKATWLGHAVRPLVTSKPPLWSPLANAVQSFIVEFPRVAAGPQGEPARVLFDPIFSECAGPSPWVGIRRRLPPPCTVAELPEFQFVVYSHNQCVGTFSSLFCILHDMYVCVAMTIWTSPRCNRYTSCAASTYTFSSLWASFFPS